MKLRQKLINVLVVGGLFILIILHYIIQPVVKDYENYKFDNPSIDIDLSRFSREPMVDLRILVLTFNRHKSLLRLLSSLNHANYFGDKVAIEVWIDRSTENIIDKLTDQVASSFSFKKGNYSVFKHSQHVGIYGQWMGIWPATSNSKEIAVFMEDDMIVSPIFYQYLKNVHTKYKSYDKINGFALHCSMNHYSGNGVITAPSEHLVFLYPIIGTWGFSPKLKQWKRFTNWYKSIYKDKAFQPFVPNIIPTTWYKGLLESKRADSMWEMWHIYHSWFNKEYTLYPNFLNCSSLTRNFREKGLHFSEKSSIIDPMVTFWDIRYNNLTNIPIVLHKY